MTPQVAYGLGRMLMSQPDNISRVTKWVSAFVDDYEPDPRLRHELRAEVLEGVAHELLELADVCRELAVEEAHR